MSKEETFSKLHSVINEIISINNAIEDSVSVEIDNELEDKFIYALSELITFCRNMDLTFVDWITKGAININFGSKN